MVCLHGNEYRTSTWSLMSASLLLLQAVVWHLCAEAEDSASIRCFSSAWLSLFLGAV
jgi:hypothetical protein